MVDPGWTNPKLPGPRINPHSAGSRGPRTKDRTDLPRNRTKTSWVGPVQGQSRVNPGPLFTPTYWYADVMH